MSLCAYILVIPGVKISLRDQRRRETVSETQHRLEPRRRCAAGLGRHVDTLRARVRGFRPGAADLRDTWLARESVGGGSIKQENGAALPHGALGHRVSAVPRPAAPPPHGRELEVLFSGTTGAICSALADAALPAVVVSCAPPPIEDTSAANPVETTTVIARITAVVTARMRTTRLKTQKCAPQSSHW